MSRKRPSSARSKSRSVESTEPVIWCISRERRGPDTAPEPPGLTGLPLHPAAAAWRQVRGGSMALLGYDQVRRAQEPRSILLGFLESAYDAGVRTAGWDREELTSSFCPSPA